MQMATGRNVPAVTVSAREVWISLVLGMSLVFIAAAVMAALHERHYQQRRKRVAVARSNGSGTLENIAFRVDTIERILCEDRFT